MNLMKSRASSARENGCSLDSLQSYVQEKFDGLTLDMQRCQGETVKHLVQLQEQMTFLESQIDAKLSQVRVSSRSTRGRTTPQEPLEPLFPAINKATVTTGPTELVPLLLPEAQGPPQTTDRRDSANNSLPQTTSDSPQISRHEKLKTAQEAMKAGGGKMSWSVKVVTGFLEDPESSYAANCYSHFMLLFLVFSIVMALLPYVDLEVPIDITLAIDAILFLEIFIRGVFCPNLQAFFFNHANIIDGLSAAPLIVMALMECEIIIEEWGNGFLIFSVPVIRFLRLVRRFPKMQILISAFKDCLEALPVLMYTLVVMGCIFTSAIFLVEPRDNIKTLSESAWFVLTTISTVGYGDITPETKSGSALASVLMVVSQLYMAMPFGIIGYNFTEIWGNRAQILLLNGTRDRLAKWGFGAYQMPALFSLFDLDDNAEIDLQEFLMLLKEMEIGFKEDDVSELFKVIDKDNGGTIDEKEFVKTLYPQEFRYMYGKKRLADMVPVKGEND